MAKLTPQERIALAYATERKYGLPKGMLVGQLNTESSNGQNNYNPESGATGPMQFMPATAKQWNVDPNDDTSAIDGAGRFMAQNIKDANGNPAQALRLYYAGSPNGIGPKSNAYVGQVAAKWNDDDAFEAAMGGNKQAPQQDAVAKGGEPAAPGSDPHDDDAAFTTAMGGNIPTAPDKTEQPGEDPKMVQLRQGIEQVAHLTHSPTMVRRYIADSGYDPDSIKNLDEVVKAGIPPGGKWWQSAGGPGTPFSVNPLTHDTATDLETGFKRGTDDVFGTLNQFSAAADKKVPFLGAIDDFAHGLGLGPSAQGVADLSQANILNRKAYDQNFDSVASGVGRLGGQVAATAPAFAATGGTISALAPEALAPVAEFATGGGGSNLLTRGASMATAGAGMGAATNALTASSSDEPLGQHVMEGAKVGAIAGPAAGAVGSAASAIVNRVAPGVDDATARLAKIAQEKYGFNLGGDQITNSPLVRKVSAMMDLNPVNNNLSRDAEQRAQFTRAVGRTFGADADELSPQVMSGARKTIGGQMNEIAARNPIHVDDELLNDLGEVENTYSSAVTSDEMGPIRKQLDNVIGAAKTGNTIDGPTYQRLVSKGSPLDVAANSANPNIRSAAIQIRGALDDALERSATASGNGADVAALRATRLKYKNLMTVAPLVSKDTGNQITPALLNNRVSVNFKNRAFQGAGDLDELAQIGKRFLAPPNTSGTPEGIRANRIIENTAAGAALPIAIGGHYLGFGHGADAAAASLYMGRKAIGAGTNAILKKVIQSEAYKNLLLKGSLDANPVPAVNLLPSFGNVGVNRLATMMAQPQPQLPPQ